MERIDLPHDAKAGPTKPPVRSVLLDALELGPDDHFVEVGSCTGAVTIEAARRVGRVTALERKADRAAVTEKNLAANGIEASDGDPVEIRVAEAPEGLPTDADALFLGGSRNFEAVLDHAVDAGIDRVAMNVSRLEVAGRAVEAFKERDLLEEVLQLQVSRGYQLAGATSFDSENPVYVILGRTGDPAAVDGGTPDSVDASRVGGDRR